MFQRVIAIVIMGVLVCSAVSAEEGPGLSEAQWHSLKGGNVVLLSAEKQCPFTHGGRYVSGAILVNKSRAEAWDLLSDPELAPTFCDDMVTAKVLSIAGQNMVVEQAMKVTGLRTPIKYKVNFHTTPREKIEFDLIEGQFRGMDGAWWFYPGSGPGETLLIYSLFVDPGFLAPQAFIKSSLKKKIPETLLSLRAELDRRKLASN